MPRNDNDDAASGLSDFFNSVTEVVKELTAEERIEEALNKSLENTTPSSPGTAWDEKEDFDQSEEKLKQDLIDRILGR